MNAPLRVSGQAKDLGGGFTVRRLLPAVQRQAVGPFLFFDHFGPVTVEPDAVSLRRTSRVPVAAAVVFPIPPGGRREESQGLPTSSG